VTSALSRWRLIAAFKIGLHMTISASITQKLTSSLSPSHLEVINESHLHAGHQEKFNGAGETHFRIRIVTDAFTGKNRIDRHRAITGLLTEELAGELHALAIEASAPGEPVRRAV
jgi:BolA family transcriptional regulator, general stress-responsive regulator